MNKPNRIEYYRDDQYRDHRNLDARATLHRRFSTNPKNWLNWVVEQIEFRPGDRILECGCGPGWLWEIEADILADCSITLTDLSPGMLAKAQEKLVESQINLQFQEANIESLPFEEDAFDIVIANHMLYHVPDRPKALAEVRRVLKPTGRFYAATNGESHMAELRNLGQELSTPGTSWNQWVSSRPFTLENGPKQLSNFFGQISLVRYEDGLRVTEVEPLLASLCSSSEARAMLTEERLTYVKNLLEQRIEATGSFDITKDVGLFIAS